MIDRNTELGFGRSSKQTITSSSQPAEPLDPALEEDLAFVSDRFHEDGLTVPENLSEDSIRALLRKETLPGADDTSADTASAAPDSCQTTFGKFRDPRRVFVPKRPWVRPFIAIAACAMLVIGLFPAMQAILPSGSADPLSMTPDANGLYQFRSYGELDRQMRSLLPEESYDGESPFQTPLLQRNEDMAESIPQETMGESDMAAADGEAAGGGSNAAAADGEAAETYGDVKHSNTYTQVEGIDEADIVKTDGRFIYYLSCVSNQVNIAKASGGKAENIAAVSGSKAGSYINDLYVRGDQLILIGTDEPEMSGEATAVTVYDISNRENPRQLSQYTQMGHLLSSRLIGEKLVLVTNNRVYRYQKNANVPWVCYDDSEPQKLPIEDISCFPQVSDPSFTVIGILDLHTGRASHDTVRTKAVLGGSDEIYCNDQNLYVTARVCEGDPAARHESQDGIFPNILSDERPSDIIPSSWRWRTQVLKVSLSGGRIRCDASALVDGTVNDQFSMDERDGTFRIATTSDRDGTDTNNLYLLDEKMQQIGSLIGFAKNEHIEAVRYVKDKAYVITYRQTDPLFIIDLSDPTEPVMEGNVKISGFSTLLVPADNDHLLGLGFSTESTEFGEATDGVKLVIFDVSDPSHPKAADSREFPDMSSPVQYDHKALLADPDGQYYAIPYSIEPTYTIDSDDVVIYDDAEGPALTDDAEDSSGSTCGILVFSAKAGQLRILRDLHTENFVRRCVSIGEYIYGIEDDDSIEGFRCSVSD